MGTLMSKTRKTEVTKTISSRRWLLVRIILLMFCVCMFNSDARALYSIFETGTNDVYGIYDSNSLVLPGAEFGSVIVIASGDDAYSIVSFEGDITINGLFDSVGIITATAGDDGAFGLYTPDGSIYTDGLDGVINTQVESDWAVGLFSPVGDVNTGDIDGAISSQAGEYWAVGLLGDTIHTGDIDGVINAVASQGLALGLYGGGVASVHTGDINGTIYAEATFGSEAYAIASDSDLTVGNIGADANIVAIAETGEAYGMSSWGGVSSLHTGNIDGKITADVNDGSGAYALYSSTDIVVNGNIGSTALIGATAMDDGIPEGTAYGMYAGDSITIGDVNGTIYAQMIDGAEAFAIYAVNDVTIGDIGSDANIWAKAEDGVAVGIYSGGGITTLTTGDIAGRITADVNDGTDAYAMYSETDIVVDGNIASTAVIGATATGSIELSAYGMYAGDSITIGDVNGTIYANKTEGMGAYAIYAVNDVTIGDIGSDANIWAAAEYGDAYGIYSGSGITTLTTGDIAGRITADVNDGSDAYAMYSETDIVVDGNIASTAVIGATATGEGPPSAYGMYAEDSIYIGDVNGTIYAEKTEGIGAYAIYAANDVTIGDIGSDANIWASAKYGGAYGIRSDGGVDTLTTGDIDGRISADANDGYYAFGMYSETDLIVGDIGSNAEISASAEYGSAYAMSSWGGVGSLHTGSIAGDIIADVNNGSGAFAMYSNADIIVDGNITSTAMISATATQGVETAYGMYSSDSITIGDVNGIVSAEMIDGSDAYAIYAANDVTIGNIGSDANIWAKAEDGVALGIYSGGGITTLTTGDIAGRITADVNDGSDAYAMYSETNIVIDGNIGSTALISATASEDWAAGLYAIGSIYTGDVNGTISADANDFYAYAMFSGLDGDFIVDGNIGSDALISATAGQDYAYGLYGVGDVNIGDIDGEVTAVAGSDFAAGLRAIGGSIYTGNINGTITAMAEDSYAWALYSSDSLSIHTGDINGVIIADVNDGSYAYGMYSTSSITTGNILSDALISASASGNFAYGLFSLDGDSIYTGDIDGTITATTGGNDAGGLYSAGGSVTTGDINGTISATAAGLGNDTAYGIYGNGSVTIGDVNGIISAEMTNGSGAYAIRSDTDVNILDITNNALISAMAEYGDAYGIYSGGGVFSIYTGDVNGVIIADANDGDDAYGMYSGSSIITGDFGEDANVIVTAGNDYAYGLSAMGIETGAINGAISATAGANYATGLSAMGIDTGAINGTITATADANYAVGLSAMGIDTGAINGIISATATNGSNAYGLSAIIMDINSIGGTVSAWADVNDAYALYTSSDMTIGDVDSNSVISATTGNDRAVGLLNTGSNSLTTGEISGIIDANAGGDYACGIMSYGPMDVNVAGGTVRAFANDGNNVAAILSGRFGEGIETQDANDTLGIAAGSTIIGDIDLANFEPDPNIEHDLLTLWGDDANSTTFAYDINNVETIDVTGGTFYVDGNVVNSANGITVYDGVLGGDGNLLCDLHVMGGIFAPGHSIDTIYIGGDWIHDPNGIYEAEVDNNEAADLAIVDGTTYLDGTIRGKVFGERIDHSFSALVIDSNGLSGEFADVNSAKLFPIFSVTYDTDNNDVYLGVLFDYAYYARTNNQRAVGQAFNQIVSSGRDTGDMNDVLTAIENLPDGEAANEAYNQLMPQDQLGLPDVTRRIMGTHNDGIMERMDNRRRAGQYTMLENNRYLLADAAGSMALLSETGEWMPFVKGIGIWADRDSERDIAGYKYKVYGAIAGMDKQVSDNSIMGFGIGGLRTKVDYTRGSTEADIDSLLLSLQGSYFGDDWHLDYTAGYGRSWYDQQRGITFLNRTAKSDHTSNAYTLELEYGQNLGGPGSILEPVAGVGYTLVQEDGYTEKDAGAANLRVDSEDYDGFYTKLGIQTTTEVTFENNPDLVMVPKLSATWVHDFADSVEVNSSFIGGGSFKTEGLDSVDDMFNVGAGLNAYFNDNARIFVDYVWQFSSDFESHMLQAGIQWPF